MADLRLLQGPAGSGKSALAKEMKDAGMVDLVADTTLLWAAVGYFSRGPDGKFPIRDANDPALRAALYLQATTVAFALRENLSVAVTTSRPDQVQRWNAVAEQHGARFSSQLIDPGERVIRERLADADGTLAPECVEAIDRWYRPT